MRAFPENAEGRMLRLTRDVLAAEPHLLPFFGASRIRVMSRAELKHAQPAPSLAITLYGAREESAVGERVEMRPDVLLTMFLPPQFPCNPELTIPAKPVASLYGAGAYSGTVRYAITTYDRRTGESYASELSEPLALNAGKAEVYIGTSPAGTGRRVWRTKDSGTCAFWHSLVTDNTTDTIRDDAPDSALGDEIFPEQGLQENLVSWLKIGLKSSERLEESGVGTVDACLFYGDAAPGKYDPARNQWIKEVTAKWTTQIDPFTRQATVG